MKLSQILALEKETISRYQRELKDACNIAKRPAAFEGLHREYRPYDEEGQRLPPESKVVEANVENLIEDLEESVSARIDVDLHKDLGNQSALASLELGASLQFPPTFLLSLEKRLKELRLFAEAIPILDRSHLWPSKKENEWNSSSLITIKTKKKQRPVVLYEATKEHPAQTQLITEDQAEGEWHTTKLSGAVTEERKRAILKRIDALLKDCKKAREEANQVTIDTTKTIGSIVFKYIFSSDSF